MKALYIDCFSGISGDMALAAMVDLGVPLEAIEAQLKGLGLSGYSITCERGQVSGIDGVRCRVEVAGANEAIAEGTVVSSGAPITLDLSQPLIAIKGGPTQSLRPQGDHEHRPFKVIRRLLEGSELSPQVQTTALKIFSRLAEAEAAVHGTTADEVAFHEVGSLDAIIDIVGVSAAFHLLGVDVVHCAPLPMARGWVDCAHGRMPLPAPAVAELIRGVPIVPDNRRGEWVTPTGAAIATTLATEWGDLPPMVVERVGYGLGRRDGGATPNALRMMVGELTTATREAPIVLVEANIDDMSPQLVGHTLETLLEAGAVDAWVTPIQMKKNRPAIKMGALCPRHMKQPVIDALLRESTTIGVRISEADRVCLERRFETVETVGGPVRLKISGQPGAWPTMTPEYDDCLRASKASGAPLKIIQQQAIAAGARFLDPHHRSNGPEGGV